MKRIPPALLNLLIFIFIICALTLPSAFFTH
jgi:hypothetical protein